MQRIFFVVGCLFVAACASAPVRRESCDPVPPELARLGTVYTNCEVDVPAERKGEPMVKNIARLSGGSCVRLTLDFVVDTNGRPRTDTVLVFKTNNAAFAAEMLSSIGSARYSVAVKNKRKVQQYVRDEFGHAITLETSVVSFGELASTSRPSGGTGVPPC